jgi:hypothetical protein
MFKTADDWNEHKTSSLHYNENYLLASFLVKVSTLQMHSAPFTPRKLN